jgi:hypothetical protein
VKYKLVAVPKTVDTETKEVRDITCSPIYNLMQCNDGWFFHVWLKEDQLWHWVTSESRPEIVGLVDSLDANALLDDLVTQPAGLEKEDVPAGAGFVMSLMARDAKTKGPKSN